ncbi:MAG: hypothetical protein BGP09_32790 [Rhizobium sp. 60-20]|nr:MAG: hypothetical protein BGP09_32790 [Rhizobium sp. 60-20]
MCARQAGSGLDARFRLHSARKKPRLGGGVPASRGSGVPLRAVPDQGVVPVRLARPQRCDDRDVEARVVEFDGDVGLAVVGDLVPACADLDAVAGGDAEVRGVAGDAVDRVEAGLEADGEGADVADDAVLGQLATVFLK